MKVIPVILCGGFGARLWPLSRHNLPKQYLDLTGEMSLFQQSVLRVTSLSNNDHVVPEILIITNENHRFIVLEQLEKIKTNIPTRILLEPASKNTAPALTLAAYAVKEKHDDAVLVVTPADHYIRNENTFIKSLNNAIKEEDECIVTMGIKPSMPDSNFGYIEFEGQGICKNVIAFKEKPNYLNAKTMLKNGKYAWNSGIFVLKSSYWIKAINKSNSLIDESIETSWKNKTSDKWFERPSSKYFNKSPVNSIDYAVMENLRSLNLKAKLIMFDAGWSDLGSFIALGDIEKKDEDGNFFKGDIASLNTKNSIAISTKKNISLLGVDNLIVIETSDCIFISSKDSIHSIKNFLKSIKKSHSNLIEEHNKVLRPWGYFEIVDEGKNFKVKRITVKSAAKLSYQSHRYRNEHWVVVKGTATIIQNGEEFKLNKDESTYIKKGVKHQLMNYEEDELEIIEIQTGSKILEGDIERYNDLYGRIKK